MDKQTLARELELHFGSIDKHEDPDWESVSAYILSLKEKWESSAEDKGFQNGLDTGDNSQRAYREAIFEPKIRQEERLRAKGIVSEHQKHFIHAPNYYDHLTQIQQQIMEE